MRWEVCGSLREYFIAAAVVAAWSLVASAASAGEPVNPVEFEHVGITAAWRDYADVLSFGQGQTLALVDDGCDLAMPEWTALMGQTPKVLVSYDSVDGDDNPKHEGKGYHGSTIGIPSSLNYGGKWGVVYNDQVAIVRALECCHCQIADSQTLAAGLQWVLDNHQRYHITTVNLAPVDDQPHDAPVPTEIDAVLPALRHAGIWVSAPAGNHNYTAGISWPACQPDCFAIGAVLPDKDEVHLDRCQKINLLVPAGATSSSNAIACGAAMILREAIEKTDYDWRGDAPDLPTAMLSIMQRTGVSVIDAETGRGYRRLDLTAALRFVFNNGRKQVKAAS